MFTYALHLLVKWLQCLKDSEKEVISYIYCAVKLVFFNRWRTNHHLRNESCTVPVWKVSSLWHTGYLLTSCYLIYKIKAFGLEDTCLSPRTPKRHCSYSEKSGKSMRLTVFQHGYYFWPQATWSRALAVRSR